MRKLRLAAFGAVLLAASVPIHAQPRQPDQTAPGPRQFHIVPYDLDNGRWKDFQTEFRSPCDDESNTDPDCLKYRRDKAAGPHPG